MSTSYSKAQLHKAFYAAAEHIERNPASLDHGRSVDLSDGTGCMLVHVGHALGMRCHDAESAAISCGIRSNDVNSNELFSFLNKRENHSGSLFGEWSRNAGATASGLRAFADLHYAEQLDPSYIKARTALQRFIEGDDSARVEFKEAVGVMYDAAVQRGMEESGYAR